MITTDSLFLSNLPKFNKQTYTNKEADGTEVEYQYNSFGYRTPEPETFNKPFILAFGCSHTEGIGQHVDETWTYKLSQLINMPVANFGRGGSGADFVEFINHRWIESYAEPSAVIIQWPNPIRAISWQDELGYFRNISDKRDRVFNEKVFAGELNFYMPWIKSINLVNQLWKLVGVPVLNCYFDTFPKEYSQYVIPKIYSNDIVNEQPWLFDSRAHDLSHHSDWCTTQWANRIKNLLTTDNFPI